MSLIFEGPGGSFERRWIVYAMLRDNVQHHLEQGQPSAAFEHLHRLGDALSGTAVSVPALALRDELTRAKPLLDLPIADLAVSLRTRAVQTLAFPLPERRNSVLVSAVGWTPSFPLDGAKVLGDAFGSLVVELLRIIGDAGPDDVVSVTDG